MKPEKWVLTCQRQMEREIKNALNDFKKNVKKFRKVSKKDKIQGKVIAQDLVKQCKEILGLPAFKSDDAYPKYKEELNKLHDALKLYIQNVEALEKFDSQYKKSQK